MLAKDELPACPVEISLFFVGDRWKLLIVRELLTGTKRFGVLKHALTGISQKVLTQNLRMMEHHGLVHREAYAEIPPRVEYSLTETGESLKLIIDALWQWGESWKVEGVLDA